MGVAVPKGPPPSLRQNKKKRGDREIQGKTSKKIDTFEHKIYKKPPLFLNFQHPFSPNSPPLLSPPMGGDREEQGRGGEE